MYSILALDASFAQSGQKLHAAKKEQKKKIESLNQTSYKNSYEFEKINFCPSKKKK